MDSQSRLIEPTGRGLYCAAGGFHIDPWRPVERAVVTHAHSDHARSGSASYLAALEGSGLLRERLGPSAAVRHLDWGEAVVMNGVRVSLHPAGHILGSAQVRVEHQGEIWIVTGDFKTARDPTCTPFEPLRCHVLVTESTFGLPIYRWPEATEVFREVNEWWRMNAARGRTSLLLGYALGKAQRLLAGLDPTIGPILTHGAVERYTRVYRASGIRLPDTAPLTDAGPTMKLGRALVVAPPSALGSSWAKRLGDHSSGLASGWMRIRGVRRRRGTDRGFALSDHADWPGILAAVEASGAERVLATHGHAETLARFLRERGLDAAPLSAPHAGEAEEEDET